MAARYSALFKVARLYHLILQLDASGSGNSTRRRAPVTDSSDWTQPMVDEVVNAAGGDVLRFKLAPPERSDQGERVNACVRACKQNWTDEFACALRVRFFFVFFAFFCPHRLLVRSSRSRSEATRALRPTRWCAA
jgi:hypothetical protein